MSKTVLAKRGEIPVFCLGAPTGGKFFGWKSFPRENHADLKYPLSGERCAARAHVVWPWGAILDFAQWRAGTNGPSSGGLARMDSRFTSETVK